MDAPFSANGSRMSPALLPVLRSEIMASTQSLRNFRATTEENEPGYARQTYDAATDLVSNRPALSLLTVWSVGFGLGVLIGYALSEPPRDEQTAITRFGRNMLDAMSRCVPESISKHFG
jgi:hypothetical protein